MASLFPLLPVFLDLAGRAAILLSAEAACAPLARQLLEAGASVTLIDPAPSAVAEALSPPARLLRRRWRPTDLRGAAIVVAGPGERRAKRAQLAARASHAIFLTLGSADFSDVVFGEGAARGPLALALAAPGLPSALNQALLARLDVAAPARLAGFFDAAARSGARARDSGFWSDTLNAALIASPADWDQWLAERL